MLQMLCTDFCILIGQEKLLPLGLMQQSIGHDVEWAFPIQYSDGQLIHKL